MNQNDDIAREVIRQRITPRLALQRPRKTRTVRALRGLADRLDGPRRPDRLPR